jgi:hypothetical protein
MSASASGAIVAALDAALVEVRRAARAPDAGGVG